MSKILYVEDHPAQRDILAQMLELNGFEVVVAKDGIEGVEKARRWLPHLILMDLRMPRMDGFEAIKTIRSYHETAHIPIVAISSWASPAHKARALGKGANEHFTKPVDLSRLLTTISRYLKNGDDQHEVALSDATMKAKYCQSMELAFEFKIWQQQPQVAKILNELTKLTSNIIHDLRNRLGILVNYDSQARSCLQLLDALAFLRFKSMLSLQFYDKDFEIPIEKLITHDIEIQMDAPLHIMTNSFIDMEIIFTNLSLFLAEVIIRNKSNYVKIINDSSGFNIEIPDSALPRYDYLNKAILSGNKIGLFWFLLEKAVFLHKGIISIISINEISIDMPNNLIFSDIPDLQMSELAAFQQANESEETESNIYLVIRELVADMLIQLDQIYLKAYQQTNLKIQKVIQRNSQYAQLLLQNLLWLGAGMETPLERVNINEALESVRQIMHSEIREREAADDEDDDFIEVKLDLQPNLLPVLANQVNLQQVFMNLITNALEVMPRSGTLGLKTYQQAQNVMIEISDTGTGIKAEHLERIFELAFSTKQGQERGVGLHVVHSIVKKFGGKIEVKSEVDKGTTFIVSLPGQTA